MYELFAREEPYDTSEFTPESTLKSKVRLNLQYFKILKKHKLILNNYSSIYHLILETTKSKTKRENKFFSVI